MCKTLRHIQTSLIDLSFKGEMQLVVISNLALRVFYPQIFPIKNTPGFMRINLPLSIPHVTSHKKNTKSAQRDRGRVWVISDFSFTGVTLIYVIINRYK